MNRDVHYSALGCGLWLIRLHLHPSGERCACTDDGSCYHGFSAANQYSFHNRTCYCNVAHVAMLSMNNRQTAVNEAEVATCFYMTNIQSTPLGLSSIIANHFSDQINRLRVLAQVMDREETTQKQRHQLNSSYRLPLGNNCILCFIMQLQFLEIKYLQHVSTTVKERFLTDTLPNLRKKGNE